MDMQHSHSLECGIHGMCRPMCLNPSGYVCIVSPRVHALCLLDPIWVWHDILVIWCITNWIWWGVWKYILLQQQLFIPVWFVIICCRSAFYAKGCNSCSADM